MAAKNNTARITCGDLKEIRETLGMCMNEWKATLRADDQRAMLCKLDEAGQRAASKDMGNPDAEWKAWVAKMLSVKPLSAMDRSLLVMRCMEAVRLLLLSYGPSTERADEELMKILLLMRGMKEDKKSIPGEPEEPGIAVVVKRQKTITDYFA